MIQKLVRDFVKNELIPLENLVIENEAKRGLNDDRILPEEIENDLIQKVSKIGLWGLDVPEEYGGVGIGNLAKAVVMEELGKTIVPFNIPPDAPNLHFLIKCCNEEQRERYLMPYIRGEKRSAIAITEPNAGSDIGAMEMRAERKKGKWVLNGTKIFISGAKQADFIITMAVTDPVKRQRGGITAFLVDRDTPGLTITRGIPTIGEHHPYEVHYDNVELSDDQVLGEVGNGFGPMQDRLNIRRIEIAQRCVGMAERVVDMMARYALQRKTFGQYLADRQAIQWWLADSSTDIHATRLMAYHAAWKMDQGMDIRKEASMLKVYATEMATRVIDRGIQMFGGLGLTKDMPLEYMYRKIDDV